MGNDENKLKITSFADVQYEPPQWLIEPYFPIGKLTLIQGDPGVGKTSFICKIAALVSIGGKLIDRQVQHGNVLILSVEDDSSTLRGRIETGGGNVHKCFCIEEAYAVNFLHEGLQEAIKESNAKLVVFDPIQAFFGAEVNTNLSNQTRPILAYLAAVAKENECAIVLLAHMAKAKEGKNSVLRSLGSVDIPGAARSVLQIGRDPSNNDQCVAVHVKSSNAKKGESFTYTIGDRGGVTIGEYSPLNAYDVDVATTRTARGTPYEEEPIVKIVRQIMSENSNVECISYAALSSVAEKLLGESPHRDGATWNAAFKRLARELYARDKIMVTCGVKKIESEYKISGETVPKGCKQCRGISLTKSTPIDFDALLGKDEEK